VYVLGTGKSLIINAITRRLKEEFGDDSVLLLAPTGVAAVNIGGATIHSKLHIPRSNDNFESLSGGCARKFINDMKSVKFLVIDEFSMIGSALLGMIERRCQEAKGSDGDFFGGLFVYLFGDINQLPPVMDKALYLEGIHFSNLSMHGKHVFENFQATVVLTKVMRQNDEKF